MEPWPRLACTRSPRRRSLPVPHRCVDAVVEPWPEPEIPIHMGSRHQMRVEGKHISGWITIVSKDQKQLLCKKEIADAAPEGADLSALTITIPPVEKDSKPLGDRISRRCDLP